MDGHGIRPARPARVGPRSRDRAHARRTVDLVGANAVWDHDGQWAGGAYFGADVTGIVTRLLGERQPDGGWNCERANGSTRSSFHTTINVLEGLLEYRNATGESAALNEARHTGEKFLLQRNLFRRLSTGDPADGDFLELIHPNRWYYDVLRALDYFRATGASPDPRLDEALDWLRVRRLPDGRWPLDRRPPGRVWFHVDDGEGMPSAWITLRALRVLRWAAE